MRLLLLGKGQSCGQQIKSQTFAGLRFGVPCSFNIGVNICMSRSNLEKVKLYIRLCCYLDMSLSKLQKGPVKVVVDCCWFNADSATQVYSRQEQNQLDSLSPFVTSYPKRHQGPLFTQVFRRDKGCVPVCNTDQNLWHGFKKHKYTGIPYFFKFEQLSLRGRVFW